MRIPFTNYDLRLSKRGIKVLNNGNLINFVDWFNSEGFISTKSTPILEEIFDAIATEFAKIDLRHTLKDKKGLHFTYDELDYVVSERPNPLQTKFDLLYVLAYQRIKYGNALALLIRDEKNRVIRIDPINAHDYMFGQGYQFDYSDKKNPIIILKMKNIKTGQIELIDYDNIIHLRKNPNDIFKGELYSNPINQNGFIKLVDTGLSTLIRQLKDNGTLRGVVKVGSSAVGLANKMLAENDSKQAKADEIVERIKKNKGNILVLDAGEEWISLNSPFETTSTKDIDKYINLLLQFYSTNKKVLDGTATDEEMAVFFNRAVAPIIDQFVSELNYKAFDDEAITKGHRIKHYRNPFEYVSITKAIDVSYKAIQDTTRNERRELIYGLPAVEGGDEFVDNKNFEKIKDAIRDVEKDDDEKNKGKNKNKKGNDKDE